MADHPNGTSTRPIRVRRALVGSIDIYEVKDSELEVLETGGPAATQLNFAIAAFSFAFSSLGTLFTATFQSDVIQFFYVVLMVVGLGLGSYWTVQWRYSRTSIRKTIQGIKDRMDDNGTVD